MRMFCLLGEVDRSKTETTYSKKLSYIGCPVKYVLLLMLLHFFFNYKVAKKAGDLQEDFSLILYQTKNVYQTVIESKLSTNTFKGILSDDSVV